MDLDWNAALLTKAVVVPQYILNLNLKNKTLYLLYMQCRNVQSPGSQAMELPPLFFVSENKYGVSIHTVLQKTLGHQNKTPFPPVINCLWCSDEQRKEINGSVLDASFHLHDEWNKRTTDITTHGKLQIYYKQPYYFFNCGLGDV